MSVKPGRGRRPSVRLRRYGYRGARDVDGGADPRVRPKPSGGDEAPALGRIIQWFKTMTTNEYIRRARAGEWPPFRRRLWQRNYWEHIIRGEADLAEIETYIAYNPAEWAWDRENREAMERLVRDRRRAVTL